MIRTSKSENSLALLLTEMGIYFKRQYLIYGKYYDFYIPKYDLLIELDGDYWHGNRKMYKTLNFIQTKSSFNDRYKNWLAKVNKKKLLRIWASELTNTNAVKFKIINEIKQI